MRLACRNRALVFAKGKLNFTGNFLCDLTLQGQHVAQFAIIIPRPEVALVSHLNELGSDTYFVCIASHAAFQHKLHSQFTSNLVQWRLAVLVMHDRGSRDHSQVLRIEVPHLRDHFLSRAIAEVFLPGISGQILEGQNSQHHSWARFLRLSARSPPAEVTGEYCDQKNAKGPGDYHPQSLLQVMICLCSPGLCRPGWPDEG